MWQLFKTKTWRCHDQSRGPIGDREYAQRFAESDIDTTVLRDLTDQNLKELGVSLGHRRKMLRAIAGLADAAPTSPQPALTEPKPQEAPSAATSQ